jgi:uncharacterized membrane protein YheB (UPF0754 family)
MKTQNQKTEKALTDLEIMEKMVNEYVEKNEVSPFVDVKMGEDEGTLTVDMDKKFEEELQEKIEGSIEDVVGLYFTNLISEMVKSFESEDLEETRKESGN